MDSNEIKKRKLTLDECAHTDKNGVEYWYAREIMPVFGYAQWRRFEDAIKRAETSEKTSKIADENHFVELGKMVELGSGSKREIKDYLLTRYACYLIAQNGDPRKEEIAFAQSYFALQTRKQELIEARMAAIARIAARDGLTETEKLFSTNMYERGVDATTHHTVTARSAGHAPPQVEINNGNDRRPVVSQIGVKDRAA